jgi:hypothetical protein
VPQHNHVRVALQASNCRAEQGRRANRIRIATCQQRCSRNRHHGFAGSAGLYSMNTADRLPYRWLSADISKKQASDTAHCETLPPIPPPRPA